MRLEGAFSMREQKSVWRARRPLSKGVADSEVSNEAFVESATLDDSTGDLKCIVFQRHNSNADIRYLIQ